MGTISKKSIFFDTLTSISAEPRDQLIFFDVMFFFFENMFSDNVLHLDPFIAIDCHFRELRKIEYCYIRQMGHVFN